jgi:hypothetical protein
MIVELARLMFGLVIVLFHRPIADFILRQEQHMAAILSQRGMRLPQFPSPQFAHNLYFCIGVVVAVLSMARIYLGTLQ